MTVKSNFTDRIFWDISVLMSVYLLLYLVRFIRSKISGPSPDFTQCILHYIAKKAVSIQSFMYIYIEGVGGILEIIENESSKYFLHPELCVLLLKFHKPVRNPDDNQIKR